MADVLRSVDKWLRGNDKANGPHIPMQWILPNIPMEKPEINMRKMSVIIQNDIFLPIIRFTICLPFDPGFKLSFKVFRFFDV
jgi:hypothetical protein